MAVRISKKQAKSLGHAVPAGGSKYRNKKTVVDGITFDSKREAERYGELKALEKAGKIFWLELQPSFDCFVNGVLICRYVADFQYWVKDGVVEAAPGVTSVNSSRIVEDAKGVKTAVYRLKKKLVKACLNIDIVEV